MRFGLIRTFTIALLLRVFTSHAAETDYLATGVMLEQFIQREMREKGIPGVAIALIDDQKIVYARGFGVSHFEKIPGNDDAPYEGPAMRATTPIRAGSVSKLFTAILVMREVEAGRLDLDAPITNYLPNFHPTNRFEKPITLRHLLSHRSGLMREPPYGNYFEPDQPSLSKMVASMNDTEVIYEPGERTKYSNAGIAAAGYIAALRAERSFPSLARKSIFVPAGMRDSSFGVENRAALADGLMWTLHGPKFKAPVFEWGMSPAASLTTTVIDLAKFGSAIFADAHNAAGPGKLLRKESFEKMWQPQFVATDAKSGFGLGFSMSQLDGRRRARHGGAVYGFATDFTLLPDAKLGAVVVCSRDFANTISGRISTLALRAMLEARAGKTMQPPAAHPALDAAATKAWAGKYSTSTNSIELVNFDGQLHFLRDGGVPGALRLDGTNFITDGLLDHGLTVTPGPGTNQITHRGTIYLRDTPPQPAQPKPEWRSLIGEYGWDYDVLYIFEKDGQLWSLIEWFEFAPLEPVAPDIFRFPDHGSYAGEKIVFKRNAAGAVTEALASNIRFVRRKIGPEDGLGQVQIKPIKPIDELMKKALAQSPPVEKGNFKQPDLVEITTLDPTIALEVRYATTNNFLGSIFYPTTRAFLQRPAAEALARASLALRRQGFGVRVFDAYRPWAVTKVFWDATTEAQHEFVADPSKGSRHNRGCAVDLTLYELATGASVEMTGTYDETTDRSYPTYPGGTSRQRWHRELLRQAMENEGFTVYSTEWWHFDYNGWRSYPILNIPFDRF
jgi:CubicO group peptidase (beta-lactamase class C family)/D-alanyl-D-alanine dipeptidase